MTRIARPFFACLVSVGCALSLFAQEAAPTVKDEAALKTKEQSAPKVVVVQTGADQLYSDLDYVLGLTNTDEQKQLKVLKEYLDVFLIGLDRARPMRIDLVLTDEVRRYIASFPVSSLTVFRTQSLKNFTINSRKKSQSLYRLTGNTYDGYMRVLYEDANKEKKGESGEKEKKESYVIFSEKEKEVPADLPDPLKAVQHLLDKKYDLAVEATNVSEGREVRHEKFQKYRKEITDPLKQTKEEKPEDFALRKKFFETQLNEAERFYAEAKRLEIGWTLDTAQPNKQGKVDVDIAPLPDTPLAATLKQLGQKPSRFGGIARSENSILSFRLNHPLDEMRIANFSSLFDLTAAAAKAEIDADAALSAEQKAASGKIIRQTADMFIAITKAGLADGFLEAHANKSGKNTLVGGFQAVDGAAVVEILKLLPQARKDQKIEFDVDKQGDAKIHKAVLSQQHANFKDFFGSDEIYVANSKDALWFAGGENALAELKSAIEKSVQPTEQKADTPFLDFFAKLGPWIELRHQRSPKAGNVKLRTMAIDAFQLGEDTLSMQLRQTDNRIVGNMIANPGILRLAGKVIADFSKENLDGGGDPNNSKTAKKERKPAKE